MLFSASKDKAVNVWYTSNGERLGTFGGAGTSGHNGAVWTLACDCESEGTAFSPYGLLPRLRQEPSSSPLYEIWRIGLGLALMATAAQSRFLLTGSADNTMKLWDVSTGKCVKTWEFLTAVVRVAWRLATLIACTTPELTSCSEDDEMVMCITEQRSGQPSIIR